MSRSVVLAPAALCLMAGAALAQLAPNIPQAGNAASEVGPAPLVGGGGPPPVKAEKPPPDALPGAVPRADRVTPSQGGPIADPTAALFDAINRGDIASARDAIDRGADLTGHDVLGMSPLDLSVDLNRNDITFLLLSLRAGDSPPQRGGTRAASSTPVKGSVKPAPKVAVRPPPKPVVVPAAQEFAGGGTPDPAAGFLGFGPSR
jgi:hypothetical protein